MNRAINDYLVEKRKVFDPLETLGDDSDDELDLGRKASEDALKRAAAVTRKEPSQQQQHAGLTSRAEQRWLGRSVSVSTLEPAEQMRKNASFPSTLPQQSRHGGLAFTAPSSTDPGADSISHRQPLHQTLRHSLSDITTAKASRHSAAVTAHGKRKRDGSIVPEASRVFDNLQFYFFPNNSSAPARKMRIAKACEYGATWHKEWNNNITHVILDKSMNFDQLSQWLNLDKLPEHVVVVNETYPAECITYGILLDPSPARFAVKGYVPPKISRADSKDSNVSLKLKLTRSKSATAKPDGTPPEQFVIAVATSATSIHNETEADDTGPYHGSRIANGFQPHKVDSNPEFDEAIAKAKALEGIDLGSDEEGDRTSSSGGYEFGDGDVRANLQPHRKGKFASVEEKWQCMQKNTGDKSGNPNIATINILQQMADYYGQTGDEWRTRAYRKAIATLRNHSIKVTTKEEAGALPNIGPRLAEKIEEIAFTSRLRRLENAKAEPADQVLQTFMGIYGAGIRQATNWVNQGYQTLAELLEKAPLTYNQRIGIVHYKDFNSRIPRAEVAEHGSIVREALQKLDTTFEVIIGGSYRRGAQDSGDVDCLITRPDTGLAHLRNVVLGQLVPQLTAQGFLVANLAMTSKDDGSKWHGASCLPGSTTWRRLDMLLVPSDELGAALIYWSGNDIFCRSLRLLASTKGMRLNQRGLYKDVMRGRNREKLCEGTLVEAKDERKIFAALGVPWRPPEHRIC